MSDFRMFGRKAHLVIEDYNGSMFEVLNVFELDPRGDAVHVDLKQVSRAIDERHPPRQTRSRDVEFRVP